MFKDLFLNKLLARYRRVFATLATLLVAAGTFFGSQFIGVLFAAISLAIAGMDKDQTVDILSHNVFAQVLTALLVGCIAIFVLIKFLKWRGLQPKKALLLDRGLTFSRAGDVVLLYGLYFLSLVAVTILLSAFTGVNVDQTQELGVVNPDNVSSKVATFLLIAVLPPIYEEILFRGFLFNMLGRYTTKIVATTLTCALFGAAHLEYDNLNWIAAIDTLIFSGFLIYISQKHQSLYSAMLLHGMKNTIAFVVLFVI